MAGINRGRVVATFLLGVSIILIFSVRELLAAPAGNIQLVITTPEPVVAKERLSYQVVVLNNGNVAWKRNEYFVEVEFYNEKKEYRKKSERFFGVNPVQPGESALIEFALQMPENLVGVMYYRVVLGYQEERLAISDWRPVRVLANIAPPGPAAGEQVSGWPITLAGNGVLSLRYTERDYAQGFSSYSVNHSLNINTVGKIGQTPVSFNLYGLVNNQEVLIDNFLFNYYGTNLSLLLGDILPSYNSLVLAGTGLRGLLLNYEKKWLSVSALASESARKVEGSSVSNGVYERYLLGSEARFFLKENCSFAASFVQSSDDPGSLKNPGPALTPVQNKVGAGQFSWEPGRFLATRLEYARTDYQSDISSASVSGQGLRATLSLLNINNFNFSSSYSRTEPDFVSLGAPLASRDKETYEVSSSYSLPDYGSVSVYFNTYHDNLNKNPGQTTANQQIISSYLTFQRPRYPVVSVGYSLNTAVGQPRSALDNVTRSPSVLGSYTFKNTTLNLNWQQSEFHDYINPSADLTTLTRGLGLQTSFWLLSLAVNGSFSERNYVSSAKFYTNSYSASISCPQLWRDKLSLAFWSAYIRNYDETSTTTDNNYLTMTGEINYNLRTNLSLIAGYTASNYQDRIDNTNTYRENSGNIRLAMSF